MSQFYFTFILFLFLPYFVSSQTQNIQFEQLTTKDGLSNNSVKCILQDHLGFMWFCTEDGLNKFDGYNFTVYKHIPEDSSSISSNYILAICEDSQGFIWVGTAVGLNKFDPVTEKFIHYFHDEKNVESLSTDEVECVLEDSDGYIWAGTRYGLNRFNRKTQKFERFRHDPKDSTSISLDFIYCLYEDNRGILWIGTGDITAEMSGGLNQFDPKTKKFIHYIFEPMQGEYSNWITAIDEDASGNLWLGTDPGLRKYDIKKNSFTFFDRSAGPAIKAIFFDSKDNLWAGCYGCGLNLINKVSGEFIQYRNNPQDIYSLSNDKVLAIYEDRNGCLWIGTKGGGINKINPFSIHFHHYRKYVSDNERFNVSQSNNILSICEDRTGKLWLGSEGVINILDRTTSSNNWTTILSFEGTYVQAIKEDETGIFWIGTTNSLVKYDPLKKVQKWFTLYEPEYQDKSVFGVNTLFIDRTGLLWIGAEWGLYRFDRQNETYTRFFHDPEQINTLSHNRVASLIEDSCGIIWVGTLYGLNKFDPVDQAFLRIPIEAKELNLLKKYNILTMCEDDSTNIWIGTSFGLYKFDRLSEKFKRFTQNEGLPTNEIDGLLLDNHENIWISTSKGLSKFNPKTKEINTFDYLDGIRNTTFNTGVCYKNKKGEFFFGGNNGLTVFHPDSIKQDLSVPSIIITGFRKFNEEVSLDTSISLIKHITFSYHENVFSFEFAALNYINSRKNQFAYKMEGFSNDWIYLGNKHDVNFTNLNPGKYVFHVKGSNCAGVWNEQGTSVRIIITPPWWRTDWAYALYALILGSIVVGLWRFQVRRIKIRNELKMKSFEAQKVQEIDSMKSRFFANISHEFRTPLTLILGPISKMLESTNDQESRQELSMMQRNARRLQRLINQLLDLSKIEAGKMLLQARPENIVVLLNRIVQTFESQAKMKEIELKFNSDQDEIIAYVDRDKIENIFYNLLSNALKFTPASGVVCVNVNIPLNPPSKGDFAIPPFEGGPGGMSGDSKYVEITISDTGIGIPPNRLDKIFDRFYQVDDSYTREHEGSGVGLALTKELVDLHYGKIEVQSEQNKGTTFIVYLPLGKTYLKPEEIVTETPGEEIQTAEEPSESLQLSEGYTPPSHRKALPLVLIVEDNRDMRSYMQDCLASDYRIIEAVDGEDGLHRAIDKIPDLIISDVMMPRMDGFELCGRLKSDECTSHIPVILLTARASAESKIKGLELGADDYLIKPFDRTELLVRVKNLIEQRRRLRERFSKDISLQPKEIALTSYDEKFLERTMEIIEQYLSDGDFTVENLCREVGLSRMQLHRKLRALTNHSTSEFIRMLRLKRAVQLLQQHTGNVTEIAFDVGFNSLSYFTKCFRKQFGKSPSAFIAKSQ